MRQSEFELHMIRGFNAAQRGERWNPDESIAYHEGYELWLRTPSASRMMSKEELDLLGRAVTEKWQALRSLFSSATPFATGALEISRASSPD